MSAPIKWVDEIPDGAPGRTGWRPSVVEELKKRPGQWAKVETDVRTSLTGMWKRLGCEAVSRNSRKVGKAHMGDIYARWPEAVAS